MLAEIERGLDATPSSTSPTRLRPRRSTSAPSRAPRGRHARGDREAPGDLPRADRADRRALPGDRQARPAARRPVDRRGGRRDRRGARAARRGWQKTIRKSAAEIDLIAWAGTLVAETISHVGERLQPGHHDGRARPDRRRVHPRERRCAQLQGYGGYPRAICISTNDVVVHGIPDGTVVEDGDLVTIDVGVTLGTAIADSAYTFLGVGSTGRGVAAAARRLYALVAGVAEARLGNRIGDVSHAVQAVVEGAGFLVVKSLVGHGVGRHYHETPTCRTSATLPRPALGGDDDRDRADDHDGRSRGLARGGRVDDSDHRRVASRPFRAHCRDPPRRPADPHAEGRHRDRTGTFATEVGPHGGRSLRAALVCGISMNITTGRARTLREESVTVKEEKIEVEGEVVEALLSTMFRVELEGGQSVLAKISGKMRKHYIRILPGDRVKVDVPCMDSTRGHHLPPQVADHSGAHVESPSFRQAHVRAVPRHQAARAHDGDLHEPPAQAKAG